MEIDFSKSKRFNIIANSNWLALSTPVTADVANRLSERDGSPTGHSREMTMEACLAEREVENTASAQTPLLTGRR